MSISLLNSDRDVFTLLSNSKFLNLVEALNEKTIGALFMLWQMVIAQLGEHMQIDAFNQPGVESGKKHAFALLR